MTIRVSLNDRLVGIFAEAPLSTPGEILELLKDEFPELTRKPLKNRIHKLRKKGKLPSRPAVFDIIYLAKECVASYLFGNGSYPMAKSVKKIVKRSQDSNILLLYPGTEVKWIDRLSDQLLQRKFAENWLKMSADPGNHITELTPLRVLNMVMTSMRCMEFIFVFRDILYQLSEDYGASFSLSGNQLETMDNIYIVCGFCKDDYQIYELAKNFGTVHWRYNKSTGNKQRQHWWLIFKLSTSGDTYFLDLTGPQFGIFGEKLEAELTTCPDVFIHWGKTTDMKYEKSYEECYRVPLKKSIAVWGKTCALLNNTRFAFKQMVEFIPIFCKKFREKEKLGDHPEKKHSGSTNSRIMRLGELWKPLFQMTSKKVYTVHEWFMTLLSSKPKIIQEMESRCGMSIEEALEMDEPACEKMHKLGFGAPQEVACPEPGCAQQ